MGYYKSMGLGGMGGAKCLFIAKNLLLVINVVQGHFTLIEETIDWSKHYIR